MHVVFVVVDVGNGPFVEILDLADGIQHLKIPPTISNYSNEVVWRSEFNCGLPENRPS